MWQDAHLGIVLTCRENDLLPVRLSGYFPIFLLNGLSFSHLLQYPCGWKILLKTGEEELLVMLANAPTASQPPERRGGSQQRAGPTVEVLFFSDGYNRRPSQPRASLS